MTFSIFTVNAQGLKNVEKKINLLKFMRKFTPDVLCIQESNINVYYDLKISIPNYFGIYNSALQNFSGTIILMSSQVKAFEDKIIFNGRVQSISFNFGNDKVTLY